jgi:hypothetical protein
MLFFTFLSRHKLAVRVYFALPVVPAPVVTTSFFCFAQAPNPKAVRLLTN